MPKAKKSTSKELKAKKVLSKNKTKAKTSEKILVKAMKSSPVKEESCSANYCKVSTFFVGVLVGALVMWLLVAFAQTEYGKTSTFFRFFTLKTSTTQLTTSPTINTVNTVDVYSKPGINGD